jgi:ligand-binding sensor domain-containing protein/signal transduction histidine kinase
MRAAVNKINNRPRRGLFFLSAILFPAIFFQAYGIDPSRYDVRIWQSDEGLPQNTVRAIAQTPDGYLWVGTEVGLARFDGVRFVSGEQLGILFGRQHTVNALLVSGKDELWIGSDHFGLAKWSGEKLKLFSRGDGLPGANVRCLVESLDGSIYVGTESGVARFKDGYFKTLNPLPGLTDSQVNAMCEDSLGIIRVATPNGMWSVRNDGVVSADNFSIGAIRYGLRAVRADRNGNLWFGGSGGLRYVNLLEEKPQTRITKLLQQIITTLWEDRSGQRWVGTVRGAVRMRGDEVIGQSLKDAETGDSINAIFEDHEGNIWLGGRDGLYRLTPARFSKITALQGLSANDVMSVCQDAQGTVWTASFVAGLTRINTNGSVAVVRGGAGLTDDAVLSLCPSGDGHLWVGMDYGRGLNKLNRNNQNVFLPETNLIAAPIRVIHEARDGALWVGTGKGLNVIRDGEVFTYTTTNGLAGDNIAAIHEDKKGAIWIGVVGGLSRWSDGEFSNFTERQGLPNNYISSIFEDDSGDLWVGSRGGGVSRYRSGRFTTYSMRHGLFSDEIFEVIGDDAGFLWMTCRKGIFRVDRKEFDQFDANIISRINCSVFGREDGLPTVQFNGYAKPSAFKARDGRIWFPTIRGAVALEPDLKLNEQVPKVFIEEVYVDRLLVDQPKEYGSESRGLKIPAGSGRVEIHFTALSFQSPEKNRFRYKMEGLDTDWVDADRTRVAAYRHVTPGKYIFRVIACNNDGLWNETGAQLEIRFLPHFRQTIWFPIAIASGSLLIGALFYKLRVARLKALADLRIRIAQDLHDDVGSRLTRVAMVTELAERETQPNSASRPHIQNIARTVRDITRAMDEIVWTINPRNDTLENLANYVFHYAQEYFQDSEVRCRLDLPHNLSDRRVTTEERHNLFMAVKEALNNVLKHSRATEVRIAMITIEERMAIVIKDNGRGVGDKGTAPASDGLLNMSQRLAAIGGSFEINSSSGQGTTVTMRLPIRWSAVK